MADYCPAGPRLESRIGIEDFYGSCRRATVVIVEQNEGAVETRKNLTITFSLSAMQMAAGWCGDTPTSMRQPGLKTAPLLQSHDC